MRRLYFTVILDVIGLDDEHPEDLTGAKADYASEIEAAITQRIQQHGLTPDHLAEDDISVSNFEVKPA